MRPKNRDSYTLKVIKILIIISIQIINLVKEIN